MRAHSHAKRQIAAITDGLYRQQPTSVIFALHSASYAPILVLAPSLLRGQPHRRTCNRTLCGVLWEGAAWSVCMSGTLLSPSGETWTFGVQRDARVPKALSTRKIVCRVSLPPSRSALLSSRALVNKLAIRIDYRVGLPAAKRRTDTGGVRIRRRVSANQLSIVLACIAHIQLQCSRNGRAARS